MRKTFLFALALVTMFVLPFCTKDPVPNGNDIVQPNDTIPQPNDTIPQTNDTIPVVNNGIVFGQVDGMIIKTYENHTSMHLSLDLNEDGRTDLVFISEDVGSAGLGHEYVTTLNCDHEKIAILGDIIQQEQFLHIDSTFHTEDSIWWVVGVSYIYTCEQIDETDSIVNSTEKLSLYANDAGDTFGFANGFKSTETILKNRSYYYSGGTSNGDHMLIHYEYYYKNDCDYFPMDEEKYIGFKIVEGESARLGWIKIILHNDCVELIETAIQQ